LGWEASVRSRVQKEIFAELMGVVGRLCKKQRGEEMRLGE
jgi:hypothetical protein